jgi:pyruvate dehydrogenase E1 component
MTFDEFKHQLPDVDPAETEEWLASFDQLVEQEGESRARFLVYKLLKRARQLHVGLPPLTQTRYINTISPEQEPFFPGDEQIEHRCRQHLRADPSRRVQAADRHGIQQLLNPTHRHQRAKT